RGPPPQKAFGHACVSESLLKFFRAAGKLKTVARQGWVDRGIPNAESVADHTFRAMVMAWVLGARAGLDTNRLLKLMLLHDLPEGEAGDATPYADVLASVDDLANFVLSAREVVEHPVLLELLAEIEAAARG